MDFDCWLLIWLELIYTLLCDVQTVRSILRINEFFRLKGHLDKSCTWSRVSIEATLLSCFGVWNLKTSKDRNCKNSGRTDTAFNYTQSNPTPTPLAYIQSECPLLYFMITISPSPAMHLCKVPESNILEMS